MEPTSQTLSYYVTFQSFFINPRSVDSYLSGIANQLEPFFPDVRKNQSSQLVARTLAGAKRCRGTPTVRKSPLTVTNLLVVSRDIASSTHHDDILFDAQLNSGFTGLLHLGELTWPDKLVLRNFKKVTMRSSFHQSTQEYSFWLPTHKTDTTFEGNKIIICKKSGSPNPLLIIINHGIHSSLRTHSFGSKLMEPSRCAPGLLADCNTIFWVGYCQSVHARWRCNCHGRSRCCPRTDQGCWSLDVNLL